MGVERLDQLNGKCCWAREHKCNYRVVAKDLQEGYTVETHIFLPSSSTTLDHKSVSPSEGWSAGHAYALGLDGLHEFKAIFFRDWSMSGFSIAIVSSRNGLSCCAAFWDAV
jgi:hypothetical protein